MKNKILLILFVITGFLRSQDSSLGILSLEANTFNREELASLTEFVRREAEEIGNFSNYSLLLPEIILNKFMDPDWSCAELDCGYEVADNSDVDEVIVIDLSRIRKTGVDSTGATTVSGNMILYLVEKQMEEEPEQDQYENNFSSRVKEKASNIYDKTREVLGIDRLPINKANRWHKGRADEIPDILRVLVWELLGETPPANYFSNTILSLANGDFVSQVATFVLGNTALSIAIGSLTLAGIGLAVSSIGSSGPGGSDPDGFGNPPPFPNNI
ncbi:MAG: hypothetical protein QGH17_01035 [Candidatus Marinimicrobia bacterium]|nr:hypothetical protein [Candidatus Neomarinimicrobiota bacterium]